MAKGRPAGRSNYNNKKFLDAVEQVLPASDLAWQEVARIYQEDTGDLEPKTVQVLKRHFFDTA
jgi:hypothetical protein